MSTALPSIFFGHGSPMIALQNNAVTQTWFRMGTRFPRPKAILCISAHWCTRGIAVTAMPQPRTIHDFGAFPQALFDVRYPAPGSPDLAARVRDLLAPQPVILDHSQWGLDHGTWSVLVKLYPDADVPVVQLSMDIGLSPAQHFAIGEKLAALRDEGILIVGTGNIVHNLGAMDWNRPASAFDWAQRFNTYIHQALVDGDAQGLIDYARTGKDAQLAVPSPDHYWPLLYVAGSRRADDRVGFENDFIEYGSLAMTSVYFDSGRMAA